MVYMVQQREKPDKPEKLNNGFIMVYLVQQPEKPDTQDKLYNGFIWFIIDRSNSQGSGLGHVQTPLYCLSPEQRQGTEHEQRLANPWHQ
jgi:hypothetical protein